MMVSLQDAEGNLLALAGLFRAVAGRYISSGLCVRLTWLTQVSLPHQGPPLGGQPYIVSFNVTNNIQD